MGVHVVVVLGEGGIPLLDVADQIIAIREQPPWHMNDGQLRRIPVQLHKGSIPGRPLCVDNTLGGKEVLTIVAVHQRAEQVRLPLVGQAEVTSDTVKRLSAAGYCLAGRTGGVDDRRRRAIGAEQAEPMSRHDAIAAERLRDMAIEVDVPASGAARRPGAAATEWSGERIGRERGEAVSEEALRGRRLFKPGEFETGLILADRKRVGIKIGTRGGPADRGDVRGPWQIVIQHKRRIQGLATFLTERHIQLEFTHLQVEKIIAGFGFHPQKLFEPHESHKCGLEITVARAGPKARTPQSRGIYDPKSNVAMEGSKTEDI